MSVTLATFSPPLRGTVNRDGKPVMVRVLAVQTASEHTFFLVAPSNGRAKWEGMDDVDLILVTSMPTEET